MVGRASSGQPRMAGLCRLSANVLAASAESAARLIFVRVWTVANTMYVLLVLVAVVRWIKCVMSRLFIWTKAGVPTLQRTAGKTPRIAILFGNETEIFRMQIILDLLAVLHSWFDLVFQMATLR